jgi:type II secretory ATPase GspE/PulE/Tfp pilus assembly ATPase PilB-like protein
MRDSETIDMSIRAALTGHLVFSTIHTNNAISTINRLADMGVEPFLISSTLIMVMAQRLVRTICQECKEPLAPSELEPEIAAALEGFIGQLYHGKGCAKCNQTGYSGRFGIYETLIITPAIRDMIERKATTQDITRQARTEGFRTMFDDAVEKIKAGVITPEEAVRITMGAF